MEGGGAEKLVCLLSVPGKERAGDGRRHVVVSKMPGHQVKRVEDGAILSGVAGPDEPQIVAKRTQWRSLGFIFVGPCVRSDFLLAEHDSGIAGEIQVFSTVPSGFTLPAPPLSSTMHDNPQKHPTKLSVFGLYTGEEVMSQAKEAISRRSAIKGVGAIGAGVALGSFVGSSSEEAKTPQTAAKPGDIADQIARLVADTPLVDSHEHLIEEKERLEKRVRCDDWAFLMSHYLDSDLLTAGMPPEDHRKLFAQDVCPLEKWKLLAPWWPAVRNTGYGQAVAIAISQLYGVDDLSEKTIARVQEKYEELRKPGFYRKVLTDTAHIHSCQVNCLSRPFMESQLPDLLLQDISFLGMHMGPDIESFAPPTGIEVKDLSDWHRVIDWWFDKYAEYAVAVKSQAAYRRDLDYEDVPAEKAAPVLRRHLNGEPVSNEDRKLLEDHLFWYAVRKATEKMLPVKLHTGYYAGQNYMPLGRVANNPASVSDLLRRSPDTTFVLMHIAYPCYEELISLAKHYTNAHIDMCWAWIINPAASVQFLKHFLVTAPANKVLTFGGDYIPVEPVVGHAAIARRGIARALTELVDEGWLSPSAAMDLIGPIMCGNGKRIFHLAEKIPRCQSAPWLKT
jgi:predicted TIM-barrel fold metal-dependent hydrolase